MKSYFLLLVPFFLFSCSSPPEEFRFRNPDLSTEERVKDLLSHMTIEEKAGQLLCPFGWEMWVKEGENVSPSAKFKAYVDDRHVGMLWGTFRADPWTKKTLETGLDPELAAKTANALQRYVIENTRLGIPLFLAEEAQHGHMAIGTTVFPTGIGLASTWSPTTIEEIGKVISREIRLQGGHIAYGPVLDLVRDPRWSRIEETYGEDPVLSALMGAAMIRGTGGGNLAGENAVISTLKHFLAYGVPEAGLNGNSVMIGMNELHQNFMPPFKAAVDAGALSVMTAYNSIDGIPCTSNKYLLTDILRDEWGFNGFVVSDLFSIEGLKGSHFVAETMQDASLMAVEAGVDVDLGGNAYLQLIDAVKNGIVQESVLDSAVSRVLRLKFEMGLFENPYMEPKDAKLHVRTTEHIDVALKAARQSVVLLENKNDILPVNQEQISSVAVIGPNADTQYNMLGDYTAPQAESNIVTVREGIESKIGKSAVKYVRGCAIRDTSWNEIPEAARAASEADLAVVVVGGSSARDFETTFKETGAAVAGDDYLSDMDAGEGFDRATLDLLGYQLKLLKAVKATGTPVIVIYIQGRPMNMNWAAENADALLTAWYPGQEGGNALADVIFGEYNPAGRLPVTIPRHEGQIPVYYNKRNPKGHGYIDVPSTPLYSFGYGRSFSQFEYDNLTVEQKDEFEFEVKFTVTNTGDYDGDEVVQLYLRDNFAQVVPPVKQLKHFKRVFLKKGETKSISFFLSKDDLSFINAKLQRVVEPGTFQVSVGASSDDIRLESILEAYIKN
ncbi:glycoside hydrolase family 3 N-terminal domain-containing protein [Anaerophaga thermohalophila]|uniref:glycoside hydrolase family 3 N-terminal domain-containing protein n=1 Tax=Anaerophaga thermohalophila TaxID=177400 RepID=UPI0002E4FF36|nr:glycoside hydrolase family 3 N-terminal domain-containing protein [Anaerophaga thermohalophila]